MSKDAYVRLSHAGPQVFGPAEAPGALLFVDVERGASLADMRSAPYEIYSNVTDILVRLDEGKIEEKSDLLREQHCAVGSVEHHPGQPARVSWVRSEVSPQADRDNWLLRRARAVELEALLHWGKAIWTPTDHHYLLPSGKHGATFIKLGNALRSPRDAIVLARWLFRHFAEDDTGLVIDTGTLSAVALALEAELRRAGKHLGRVAVLEHYPKTALDTQKAVMHAAGDLRRVAAVLSVSSSGHLRDHLYAALTAPLIKAGSLDVLVDQSGSVARAPEPPLERLDTWVPLEPGRTIAEARTFDKNCELCRDTRRSQIVPINPVTFEKEYLPQLKAVAPSLDDPRRNHKFWELCHVTDALGLDEEPDSPAAPYRPRGRKMAVHVRWENLLGQDRFVTETVAALRERIAVEASGGVAWELLLVPQSDASRKDFGRLWGELKQLLGLDHYVTFPNHGEWGADLMQKVTRAQEVAVFSLGAVSGGTLQRARNVIQSARRDGKYQRLRALVVHGRASGEREWTTLLNSFAGRVHAAWSCYLPTRSVLEEEVALLDTIDQTALTDEEAPFYEARRDLCTRGQVGSSDPIFWGSLSTDRLSPHSIYGDRLTAVTTFVAVGAAMEAKRHEKLRVPERMVFDMKTITRSYYDPLILSAMLRWLLPYEPWWGAILPFEARRSGHVDPTEGSATVLGELLWRADPEQRRILIPELLLAYAQGKVPQPEADIAMAYADRFVSEMSAEVQGATKLALRLAGQKRSVDSPRAAKARS